MAPAADKRSQTGITVISKFAAQLELIE